MKNNNFYINIWYIIILFIFSWSCHSQQKRKLTPEDYKLWNTLKMGVISDDGIWTSFSKSYENSIDTLFLKNTETDSQYVFPSGYNEKITRKGSLFAFMKADTLNILETSTGQQEKYPNVKGFEFTKDGKYLIYQCSSEVSNTLVLKNIKTGQAQEFLNTKEYSLNPTGTNLVIIENYNETSIVKLVSLSDFKKQAILSQNENLDFQSLTWNATGKSLAYYVFDKDKNDYDILYAINVDKPSNIIRLEPSKIKDFPVGVNIIKTKLYISDKGDKVFFDTACNANAMEDTSKVQVWKSSDKEVPPKTGATFQRWNVWLPKKNEVYPIEDGNLIVCALADNQEKAVLLDNNNYLPLYEYGDRYSDVYIMDLNTGTKQKIIEKQLRAHHHIVADLNGKHIAYFKNKNWWSYNIKTNLHTCVTGNIDAVFNKSLSDRLDDHRAYGFGGWTSTGQMIIYDRFDIWLISPDGRKSQKLTNGDSSGIRHRIHSYSSRSIRDGFFGFVSVLYDLSDGLLIKTLNTENLNEGFCEWNIKNGFQEIVQKEAKILYVKKIGKNNGFQFIESKFDMSPKITYITKDDIHKKIAQANEQQEQYYWGKSKLIHYQGPNGEKSKGSLFYPANYNADKKYPMIVHIYENMSNDLHEYVPPSMETFSGFNTTNFTLEGYFVLLPDIAYTLNKPGNSALKCVSAAIDQAVKTSSIDENNIGLRGHSFGGFETSYIISQTDRFKTAIAGAGVNDLLSFYLDIDSSNLSNMERFESAQFRNKIPFTEMEFLSESPIMNAKTINTPVLLWAGSNDKQVAPSYSIKLFNALWRLQKKSTLLIYPDEGHVLMNPLNQKDITSKTMGWFNHHLKGFPKEDWMND